MRIRTVKPEFWRSDDITALSREHRLLYIGLWSYVDDNGVGIDDYRQIAADLFALEDDQKEVRDYIREGVETLARALLITLYEVDGKRYLYVNKWDKHQRVDRPNKPRHPRPLSEPDPPTSEDVPDPEREEGSSRESLDTPSTGTEEQRNRGSKETWSADAGPPQLVLVPELKPAPRSKPLGDPDGFTDWWSAYPKKVAKEAGRKAYAKALKKGVSPDQLLAAVKVYAKSDTVLKGYICNPATWLNEGRYEDTPQVSNAPVRSVDVYGNPCAPRRAGGG